VPRRRSCSPILRTICSACCSTNDERRQDNCVQNPEIGAKTAAIEPISARNAPIRCLQRAYRGRLTKING
jgi:hypothetical protein